MFPSREALRMLLEDGRYVSAGLALSPLSERENALFHFSTEADQRKLSYLDPGDPDGDLLTLPRPLHNPLRESAVHL